MSKQFLDVSHFVDPVPDLTLKRLKLKAKPGSTNSTIGVVSLKS